MQECFRNIKFFYPILQNNILLKLKLKERFYCSLNHLILIFLHLVQQMHSYVSKILSKNPQKKASFSPHMSGIFFFRKTESEKL